MARQIAFLLLLVLSPLILPANNIQLSELKVVSSNELSFHITWENSWNLEGLDTPFNHDAAWIFLKYREANGNWQHLDLSSNPPDHYSAELDIEAVTDGKGIFIKRKSAGSGKAEGDVRVKMSSYLYTAYFDFKVFAIEMAHVPEGAYYLGDGASNYTFTKGNELAPFYISSENGISTGNDASSLSDTGKNAIAGDIPASYPKGYNGFYCMKYEISQEQYAEFLNTLTYEQQLNLTAAAPSSSKGTLAFGSRNNRFGISIETPGSEGSPANYACNVADDNIFSHTDDGQNRACNFLDWNGVTAYLDWAALRPMTEMEFEKACRGPLMPVAREFAWGTEKIYDANDIENDGMANEGLPLTFEPDPGTGVGSHGYQGPQGPLRNGFAATANSGRLRSGASYYGIFEMSGNIWEQCVTVTAKGLKFTAENGDGELDMNGSANVSSWPGIEGAGVRGGGWNSGILPTFRDLAVSDRFYAGLPGNTRRGTTGGRGVR